MHLHKHEVCKCTCTCIGAGASACIISTWAYMTLLLKKADVDPADVKISNLSFFSKLLRTTR